MADFCKQCSIKTFGSDLEDMKNITTKDDEANGLYAVVLCEGCGACQVNNAGECISKDCLEKHGEKK